MRALRFLLRKEFLQIVRDRTILGMIFIIPIVQLLILSNAATFEVRRARMYVIDRDHTAMSRGVVDRLTSSGRFIATESSASAELADHAMLNRDVDLILVIAAGFERDLVRERRASLQLIINAEDGAAAAVTQTYANQVLTTYSAELGAEVTPALTTVGARNELPPQRGRSVIETTRRGWYNTELEYRDYMVPGILVVLVTIIGTLLTAMNIVREKEAGTLDQLNVTPVTRPTFIAAKLIPLWTFALLDLALGLGFGHFVLGVPIRGSLPLVFFAAAIYLVVALGIGLWISTIAETQQQAMFVTFSLLMVYLLMSGLFTPVRGMPEWAQWLAQLNPMMHFVQIMRSVLLKGAGIADIARPLVILALAGLAVLTLAVRQYHKTSA
ncbi:MAG TPA: ABC transporter permease [Longimicrobiales bacterium]|nr:ABC transporter permease [Longimicrobiales bacterium]